MKTITITHHNRPEMSRAILERLFSDPLIKGWRVLCGADGDACLDVLRGFPCGVVHNEIPLGVENHQRELVRRVEHGVVVLLQDDLELAVDALALLNRYAERLDGRSVGFLACPRLGQNALGLTGHFSMHRPSGVENAGRPCDVVNAGSTFTAEGACFRADLARRVLLAEWNREPDVLYTNGQTHRGWDASLASAMRAYRLDGWVPCVARAREKRPDTLNSDRPFHLGEPAEFRFCER